MRRILNRGVASALASSFAFGLASCSGGGDNAFGFLEGATDGPPPACEIVLATPTQGGNLRIANSAATSTQIVVVTNDDSCEVTYELNGAPIATGPAVSLNSASLNVGANTLRANVQNAVSATSLSWAVVRNTAPTCTNPVPAATGVTFTENTPTTFSVDFADADGDSVSPTWRLDGNPQPTLFTPSATATVKSAVFQGNSTVVGSRAISVLLNDGYDSTTCTWNVTINDSLVAEVNNCQPSGSSVGSPIVLYEGNATPVTLSGDATGTGITRQWKISTGAGAYTNIAGQTGPTLSLTQVLAPPIANYYRVTLTAIDAYSNTAECATPFYVRSNDAPSFAGSPNPATNTVTAPIKYNAGSTVTLTAGTGVTDANSDTILYTWSIDGTDVNTASASPVSTDARLSIDAGNPLSATYHASAAANGPGLHTIRVRIYDGYEFDTKTWYINPNYLSNACNNLAAGEICTLVGSASVGDGLNPVLPAHLSRIRFKPRVIAKHVVGGVTNIAFTDSVNDLVWYWNRTGGTLNYFGKRIPANSLRVILGSGRGANNNAAGLIVNPSPGKSNPSKIATPVGIAINNTNAADPVMYVSLYDNHRVVAINNASGVVPFFLGTNANSTSGATAQVLNAAGARCNNPYGLDYHSATDSLYVACYGDNSIRVVSTVSTLNASTESLMIVKSTGGTTTVNGTTGSAGTATTYAPRGLRVNAANGNVFWVEGCTTSGGYRGGNVRIYNYAGIASYGARAGLAAGAVDQVTGWGGAANCTINAGGDNDTVAFVAQAASRFPSALDLELMPNGLLVADNSARRVFYLNAGGADGSTFGGWLGGSVPANSFFKITGCESNGSSSTCTNSYAESASAFDARTYETYAVAYFATGISSANASSPVIVTSDNHLSRIRELRLDTGIVTTAAPVASIGYQRWGQGTAGTPVSGATSPQSVALYNPAGLAIDNTNKTLYIAEYSNRQVTQINLATGEVSNAVGGGASYGENQIRTTVQLGNPTNVVHSDAVSAFPNPRPTLPRSLLYFDGTTTGGANQPCLIRALQQASGANNIFGTTLNTLDTVQTILGSLATGCVPTATATNAGSFTASAGNANTVPLTVQSDQGGGVFRSMAIGVDAANNPVLYATIPEKACIVRITQNGAVQPVLGPCVGVGGNAGSPAIDISTTNEQIAIPRGIAVDPLKPQNLFVLDQGANTATGVIKYANFSASCVGPGAGCEGVGVNNNYFGQSITAGKIQSLKNIIGSPNLNDLAVNGTRLCYSAGRLNNTNQGEHSVVCYARTNGTVSLVCGGDVNEFPNRDGSPLSDVQLYERDGTTPSWGYQEGKRCAATTAENTGEILFAGPAGIVFDADGNLYVSDMQNHVVRMIKAW